jgi:hypothetical protein
MSDLVEIEIVRVVGLAIVIIPSTIGAIFSYKALRVGKVVQSETNGMKDQLIASVKAAAFEAGIKQQKENNDH